MALQEETGKSRGEIYKGIDVKSPGQFYYKIEKQIQTGNQGKFVLLNWCTPNDVSGFMKKADEISDRFTPGKMAKYGMTDWELQELTLKTSAIIFLGQL